MIKKTQFTSALEKNMIYIILVILVIVMSLANDSFFSVSNLVNVLRQCSIYAIIAFGMTFVVISGGIDLSAGAVMALVGCSISLMMVRQDMPMWPAVILGLVIGGACGLANGLMITKLKIPFFLATVAMMYMARGLALIITHESTINGLPAEFAIFGGNVDFPVPPQLIIAIIVFIILMVVLNYTRVGRYTYALGSNKETCRLSGVNVDKYTILIYTISGLCAAAAGIVMAARLKVGSPIVAEGYEMDAICAVAIGGTSMLGGSGSLTKSAIGAIVLSIISVGLNILGVSSSTQQLVKGLIIVAVVAIDMMRRTNQR